MFPMTRADLPIYEYACHEGNYSMAGILGGWRMLESWGNPDSKTNQVLIRKEVCDSGSIVRECLVLNRSASKICDSG